jgi:hypothetical protein
VAQIDDEIPESDVPHLCGVDAPYAPPSDGALAS